MAEAHERKSKIIRDRDWESLRESWLANVPEIASPGAPPDLLLHELTDLDLRLGQIVKLEVVEVLDQIPGLRSGLLHEGIFLLHKAAHVLGAALIHVSHGMCTWSVSSAYHAAFFAMKSVSCMLGVTIVESRQKHFLVDAWAMPKRPKRNQRQIVILANTDRNEQRHCWAYFQRLLSQTENLQLLCSDRFKGMLLQSDYRDFARQRNKIHYGTNFWMMKDLHQCIIQEDFGHDQDVPIDVGQDDFSLLLAFGIVQIARTMLSHLAGGSAVLREELALVDTWLGLPFNELYRTGTGISAAPP